MQKKKNLQIGKEETKTPKIKRKLDNDGEQNISPVGHPLSRSVFVLSCVISYDWDALCYVLWEHLVADFMRFFFFFQVPDGE